MVFLSAFYTKIITSILPPLQALPLVERFQIDISGFESYQTLTGSGFPVRQKQDKQKPDADLGGKIPESLTPCQLKPSANQGGYGHPRIAKNLSLSGFRRFSSVFENCQKSFQARVLSFRGFSSVS